MTIFLTFSVYSLSLTNYIPVQSQFLPLITLYIILAISYTLLSMIWFIIKNLFQTNNKMPDALVKFAELLQFVFFPEPCKKSKQKILKIKNERSEVFKTEETIESNQIDKKTNDDLKPCIKCVSCDICKANKEKENQKKLKKNKFDLHVSALNRFALLIIFTSMVITNLFIWISLSKED